MEPDFEKKNYQRAKKKVKEIKSFYFNLTCYCTVIPVLIFINLRFTPDYYWFLFSMGGWGIGLFFHAMAAFNFNPFFNSGWEERKLREFMEEDRKQQELFKNKKEEPWKN